MKTMLSLALIGLISLQKEPYSSMRNQMVKDQIQNRGIKNEKVLQAFRKVPRHLFVPVAIRDRAYDDNALPIDFNQTISQPFVVAYMTEIVDPDSTDIVLEIGTGSGYQAAILAEIVKKVYTVEIIPGLAMQAKKLLTGLGYKNIEVRTGDGYIGWEEHAPYDAIIVTAAPEEIPQPLIDQLKEGGRMIIPVGPENYTQYLVLLTKVNGRIKKKNEFPVRFVPFTRDRK